MIVDEDGVKKQGGVSSCGNGDESVLLGVAIGDDDVDGN